MRTRLLVIFAAGVAVLGLAVAVFRSPSSPPEPAPALREAAPAAAPEVAPAAVPEPAPAARPARAAATPAPRPAEPAPAPDAPPTTGTLEILSDVPETSVFLDRVYLGTAPVTARDVAPGPHQLKLVATGYESYAESIDVVAGSRTVLIKFTEIRLDLTLAVTHRHAFGSCAGTLRATPGGLTYDTANKSDAFTLALTGIETFTMDYLEKNLRVKIKGGKAYNFADAGGDVNRLYLFHQEVEKVRQRLLAGR